MMQRSLLIVGLLLLACDKAEPERAAPSAVTAPASAPAPAPAAPEKPWYVGSWRGSYDAQHYLIETNKGEALKQWKDDDGKQAAGAGKLSLEVAPDGRISGGASGPLGEMIASGEVDDDSFRVQLRPSATAFQGFFVAKKKGAKLEGRLQASSGDSLIVRDAPVSLESSSAPKSPP
jgi:hypothetical protein